VLGDSNSSKDTLIYIFLGVSGLAFIIIAFLRKEEVLTVPIEETEPTTSTTSPKSSQEIASIESSPLNTSSTSLIETSLIDKFVRVLGVVKESKMLVMIPSFLASGCIQSFMFGIYTGEIITPSLGTNQIGYVMTTFGFVNFLVFIFFGSVGEKFNNYLYIAMFGYFVNVSLLSTWYTILNIHSLKWLSSRSYVVFMGAGLFSIGDSALYLYIRLMMSFLYTEEVEIAYSILQFFKSFSMALTFAIGPYFTLSTKIIIFLVLNLIGFYSSLYLHLSVLPNTHSPSTNTNTIPNGDDINITDRDD
jgi:hypothetical protein